jgi:hypothetical protein
MHIARGEEGDAEQPRERVAVTGMRQLALLRHLFNGANAPLSVLE